MKELTSRKSGKSHIVSDEDYNNIIKLGIIDRYRVVELPELRQLKPDLKLDIETKKVLKTK